MQRHCAEPARRPHFDVAWPWRGSAARRSVRAEGKSNRENRGARNPMQRRCAIGQFRHFAGSMNFETPQWGPRARGGARLIVLSEMVPQTTHYFARVNPTSPLTEAFVNDL
jgi:hypothetical protein